MTGEVTGDAPAVRATYELLLKYWESNDQVPRVGEKVEPWLRQTGLFSEVNAHEVILPLGNRSPCAAGEAQISLQQERQAVDPKVGALATIFTDSSRRGFSAEKHHPGILALGFTPELKSQCVEQVSTSEWQMDMPLSFVCARKFV